MIRTKTLLLQKLVNGQGRWLFSTVDPYYLLGVEKDASFPEIKKTFYKLASQFHPDRNPHHQAKQKFLSIKEAFEMIKMEKGLTKPQDLESSSDRQSVRPDPSRFTSENEENHRNFRDYTVFSEKAGQAGDQYSTFGSSFKNISDINDIKVKVEEGQIKDAADRFDLGQFKATTSFYNEGSTSFIAITITVVFIFACIVNYSFAESEVEAKEGALKKLTKIHQRKTIESDFIELKKVGLKIMENTSDLKNIKQEFMKAENLDVFDFKLVKDKVISSQKTEKV